MIPKRHSAAREPIEVWRLYNRVIEVRQALGAPLIDGNEQNVLQAFHDERHYGNDPSDLGV